MINAILSILSIIGVIILLALLLELYAWLRRKINRPRIGGLEIFLVKLLDRGDYVSIGGRVMRFSCVANGGETINPIYPPTDSNHAIAGELMFDNLNSIGNIIYSQTSLAHCDFIFGKYGLKWAVSSAAADTAEEKVKEFKRN